jgi:hypothetical protein
MFAFTYIYSQWLVLICALATFGLIIALAFKSRDYPANMQLLAAFVSIIVKCCLSQFGVSILFVLLFIELSPFEAEYC